MGEKGIGHLCVAVVILKSLMVIPRKAEDENWIEGLLFGNIGLQSCKNNNEQVIYL